MRKSSMLTGLMVAAGLLAGTVLHSAQAAGPAGDGPATSPLLELMAPLDNPWGMAFLPSGELLITEKPGRLRVWANGRLSEPVAGLPTVNYRSQGGLLDVAVDPDFARNRFIYLSYSEAAAEQPGGRDVSDPRLGPYQELDDAVVKGLAVARARFEGSRLTDVRVIWRAVPKTLGRGHFGGALAFARDGTLLISSGDRQRFEPAQDLASDIGKIIRIRTDGTVPPDNPFASGPESHRDVWSYGHRNALGMVVDERGDIWSAEMAPLHGDEFNRVIKGGNFGWPLVSEGDHYDQKVMPRHSTRPDFVQPLTAWWPAISPAGIIQYKGTVFPGWRGSFLVGGLSSQGVTRVMPSATGRALSEGIPVGLRVRDLVETPDGQILVLVDGPKGSLSRLMPDKAVALR